MAYMVKAKVTQSGQISIPAAVRRRWDTTEVWVVDEGEQVVLRPVPVDPVATLRGKYPRRPDGPSLDELWLEVDEEEAASEGRGRRP